MAMVDPILEVWRRSEMLEVALKECKTRGRAAAEAEQAYRVKLAEKILLLREDKFPATLIGDLARGDREVAQLKFERDCAEVVYDNAKEAVNVFKRQIDVLREQIEREWSKA